MSWFRAHVGRHRNPRLHVAVAVCSAVGAAVLLFAGQAVVGVVAASLSALNLAHAIAERRRPEVPMSATEHVEALRRAARELDDEDEQPA